MKNFQAIMKSLNIVKISNEEFYKIADLEKELLLIETDKIEVSDCILTPFYFYGGKRYELYAYELNIRIVEEINFNKHLLKITGKEDIANIPNDIIARQKECCIELLQDNVHVSIERLLEYIYYLYGNVDIRNEVISFAGEFDINNLFYIVY